MNRNSPNETLLNNSKKKRKNKGKSLRFVIFDQPSCRIVTKWQKKLFDITFGKERHKWTEYAIQTLSLKHCLTCGKFWRN